MKCLTNSERVIWTVICNHLATEARVHWQLEVNSWYILEATDIS